MKFRRNSFALLFGLLVSSLFSCVHADEAFKTRLWELAKTREIEAIQKLDNKDLKKTIPLRDGVLYYLGLVLVEADDIEKAKDLFIYGYDNYADAYKSLCETRYLELASPAEAIAFFEKRLEQLEKEKKGISTKDSDEAKAALSEVNGKIDEAREKLNELYIYDGKLEKVNAGTYDTYFNTHDISVDVANCLLDYFDFFSYEKNLFFEVLNARALSRARQYAKSAKLSIEVIDTIIAAKQKQFFTRPVFSDFGRAFLNGTKDFKEAEEVFLRVLNFVQTEKELQKDKGLLHTIYFYLARITEKQTKPSEGAVLSYYDNAIRYSPSNWDYDNVLWYKLVFLRSTDMTKYLSALSDTANTWVDDYWYEDLVSDLTLKYTQEKNISQLKLLRKIIDGTNLNEAKAKLSYTIGRLNDSYLDLKDAFELKQNTWYYNLMASYFIGETSELKFVNQYARNVPEEFSYEFGIEVLDSLVRCELYSYLYGHMQTVIPNIAVSDAEKFSKILSEQGLYADSMNFIQYALRSSGAEFGSESLKLLYPRPFSESVVKYAKQYEIPEYFVYSLMRCESFFKPAVVSHAGAVGLTQLMPSTAADIARYFKLPEYDTTDPDTNIRFGTYYLAQMFKVQGKSVKAFQAYNAGGGNVRKWNNVYGNQAFDLFVEMTPFAETRNYGKNILQAACIYAKLYYNKGFNEVIEEYFNFGD